MKSLNQFFLIIAIVLSTGKIFAQETVNKGDITIHARINSVFIYGKTFIDVYKRHNEVKIIYAKQDSIRFSAARKDTAYLNASKNLNYSDQKQTARLAKILDQYSAYDTKTVIISLKKDTAYSKILQLMAQTSKNELETSKVGQRNVLDGFGFGCTIITSTGAKSLSARTPTTETHPMIAAFLEETRARVFYNGSK